ncbi:MAG: acyl-CoA dehydrogenase [Nocardiaceae bacterium]|nr:acyl-CoA dehydrogenase [Nocardiaceae bacterium]
MPETHFTALANAGFYGFALSDGMTPETLIDTAATIISGCLSTGFVWAQHFGGLRAVISTQNTELRERLLPQLTTGQVRCGVTYAGARTIPTLFAEPAGNGYIVTGTAPFVTGWGYVDAITASVRLRGGPQDGGIATVLIPVPGPGVVAEQIPLSAANASATVRLIFDGCQVNGDQVFAVVPSDSAGSQDALTDWFNGALPLGVLRRCLDELSRTDVDASAFEANYARLRREFTSAMGQPEATYRLRAELAKAAVSAASTLIVAVGSRAVVEHSDAERMMRQAAFALVCPTREPIRDALLSELKPT